MKKVILLMLLLMSVPASAYYHHESPIKWYEYNQESFDLAEKEHKPVFMLITAIWCYWCHVYRDETLHTPEVSSYLNDNFIAVFVDADQRQDLTRQYLAGGWPSSVFFSHDGREVKSINGMIRKDDLLNYLQKVVSYFESNQTVAAEEQRAGEFQLSYASQKELDDFWNKVPVTLLASYDKEYGGFGGDRKFPLGQIYEFFLYRYAQTKEPILLEATNLALKNMAPEDWLNENAPIEQRVLRGVYDPIEGGFFRYDVNRDWSVPHYEKILDTNAYTIRAYLLAYNITKNPHYREIAEHSLAYVTNTLQDSETGRLYGSQDAGHEEYYRQTAVEREQAKYEGRPRIDTTTYADWSGPMITTFLMAAEVLKNDSYAQQAFKAAEFIHASMVGEEGVLHFYDGRAQLNGLLLDNAEIAGAFFDVYVASKDEKYLAGAERILAFADARLYDATAGLYYERNSTDAHLYRKSDAFLETFQIEGNTAMALALIKAHKVTGERAYLDRAKAVMSNLIKAQDSGLESIAVQAMVVDYVRTPVSLAFDAPVNGSLFVLLIVSFIAGLLSFLSPCTLPLLPAYAVHTLQAKKDALKRTFAFFAGLALVFSILGVSVALVGRLLTQLVPQISRFAGIVIIIFGIFTIIGRGFGGLRLKRLQDGILGSFLFGTSYGVAWTPCVGPILGSIMLIAAASASWAKGGLLLFAYALGIAIPLLGFSYYVDRLRHKGKVWSFLRGKELTFRIGSWTVHTHTTNLIAGILLLIIGYLMFTGTLYNLSKLALQTSFQKKLFGLEDWLLRWIR